jgi:hypothetical protein
VASTLSFLRRCGGEHQYQVKRILHTDDRGAFQRKHQLLVGDVAEPDGTDQPFVASLHHRGELSVELFVAQMRGPAGIGGLAVHDPKVDRGQLLDA